jgi:hypothetical protein
MDTSRRFNALATPYLRWRNAIWTLPPQSGSHDSIRWHEQEAANEAWEDEGGSLRPVTRRPKIPLDRADPSENSIMENQDQPRQYAGDDRRRSQEQYEGDERRRRQDEVRADAQKPSQAQPDPQ